MPDFESFTLSGKTIVVTGGAGILGRQMVNTLARAGANVGVLDVNAVSSEDMGNVLYLNTDITDRRAVEEAKQQIHKQFGTVAGLVNNAAAKSPNFFESFENFSSEDWHAVMNVNLYGAVVCSQVFGGPMAERGEGSIVNILSIYGVMAPDQRIYEGSSYEGRSINTPAVYSASKAALFGLTKYLAAYWGDKQVRVNAISPGGVYSGQNEVFVNRYRQRVPMGRMARDTEMSGALVFLLSDAASYITGQNIMVDGGLSAW
jgi:NAD(P)-dependent dehydrogenase (short-subunit alcohol dehydrogenase family)